MHSCNILIWLQHVQRSNALSVTPIDLNSCVEHDTNHFGHFDYYSLWSFLLDCLSPEMLDFGLSSRKRTCTHTHTHAEHFLHMRVFNIAVQTTKKSSAGYWKCIENIDLKCEQENVERKKRCTVYVLCVLAEEIKLNCLWFFSRK